MPSEVAPSTSSGPGPATAVLALLATTAGVVGLAQLVHRHGGGSLLQVLAPQAAVLLVVGAVLALGRWTPGACGLARPRLRHCLAGLALAPALAALGFGLLALSILVLGPPPPEVALIDTILNDVRQHHGWLLLIAATCLLPGLGEEALMRGVVLTGLRRRLPAITAVGLAAIAFAAMHLSPWRFLPQLALGLVAGALALRTRSCWPGAVAHAAYNLIAIAIASTGGGHAATGVLVAVLAAPFGIWLAWWLLRRA